MTLGGDYVEMKSAFTSKKSSGPKESSSFVNMNGSLIVKTYLARESKENQISKKSKFQKENKSDSISDDISSQSSKSFSGPGKNRTSKPDKESGGSSDVSIDFSEISDDRKRKEAEEEKEEEDKIISKMAKKVHSSFLPDSNYIPDSNHSTPAYQSLNSPSLQFTA